MVIHYFATLNIRTDTVLVILFTELLKLYLMVCYDMPANTAS